MCLAVGFYRWPTLKTSRKGIAKIETQPPAVENMTPSQSREEARTDSGTNTLRFGQHGVDLDHAGSTQGRPQSQLSLMDMRGWVASIV